MEGLSDVPAGNEIVLNLNLDLNGILEVTATEKRTGLSKTVRMDTGMHKDVFDINKARKNIAALSQEEDTGVTLARSTGEFNKEPLISRARDLRKRAEELMDDIDETDASELSSLIQDSKEAIAKGDFERLEQLNESLSDMLFYLED